jgi:hypothetical protein
LERYFHTVFALNENFPEERLHYALHDLDLAFTTKELILMLYADVQRYQKHSYTTSMHEEEFIRNTLPLLYALENAI